MCSGRRNWTGRWFTSLGRKAQTLPRYPGSLTSEVGVGSEGIQSEICGCMDISVAFQINFSPVHKVQASKQTILAYSAGVSNISCPFCTWVYSVFPRFRPGYGQTRDPG